MVIEYQSAPANRSAEYIQLRGLTRQNSISEETLRALGITAESWARDIESGTTQGFIAMQGTQLVGYCFGDVVSGEVLVLAIHSAYEAQGVGKKLLSLVVEQLRLNGHAKLFLGCSPEPGARSHGFYRHLGWHSTGGIDANGDEVLEFAGS